MIPGIHYPADERYEVPKKQPKCPHCGYVHKVDISYYRKCVNCGKSMSSLETPKKKGWWE